MTKGSTLAAVKASQRRWATTRGLDVDSRGRVRNLTDNLFAPLNPETLHEFESGDGDELGTTDDVGKLHSLWSSAALVCNVFDYWRERRIAPLIAALDVDGAGYQPPHFEQKFRTGVRNAEANLDLVIPSLYSSVPTIAIESKFTEPYQSGEKGCLRQSYFGKQETWRELALCRSMAESLTTKPFDHLDAGQLLKHILGLTRAFGAKRFVLLYLWYDVDGSDAARKHEDEVMAFSDAVRGEVLFRSGSHTESRFRAPKYEQTWLPSSTLPSRRRISDTAERRSRAKSRRSRW